MQHYSFFQNLPSSIDLVWYKYLHVGYQWNAILLFGCWENIWKDNFSLKGGQYYPLDKSLT